MFEQIRKRLSSAHLIAFAALVVALSGTAYAATKIDTDDIKKKAVTKQKLDKDAVSTNRIRDGAVQAAKLGDAAVSASKLGSITEVDETSPPAAVPAITATAECPAGTTVISGGFRVDSIDPVDPVLVVRDRREDNGWQADGVAQNAGDTITAYAYCLEG
jgi:hypothetical protein